MKWKDDEEKSISSDAIVNVILFLCNQDFYLPIPAQNKKELIHNKMKDIIKSDRKEKEGASCLDNDLFMIRNELTNKGINNERTNNPFWLHQIRPFWDESIEDLGKEQLADETLLEYKKAMILYGPPGTSKSYQARQIAESMIARALRNNNSNINDCITSLEENLNNHIHILQMHPNYTYDDFIIGKSIDSNGQSNKVVVKPGELLRIISSIKPDDNLPHFIILDEINRVDISRVFGELFTAMETSYRDKGVELPVNARDIPNNEKSNLNIDKESGKISLKVPENMYFIGTMNMIDFSLEQIDFALRRRFIWKLSTYNEKRLKGIISEKIFKILNELDKEKEKLEEKQTKETKEQIENINKDICNYNSFPDNYSENCTALNNEIEWESSLGKNYLIGHTFFTEIVDIFDKIKDWDKAKNVLWQISILPTLEAYCGTMDANNQEKFINKCREAFFPEK